MVLEVGMFKIKVPPFGKGLLAVLYHCRKPKRRKGI
jgi:hypothetical protein